MPYKSMSEIASVGDTFKGFLANMGMGGPTSRFLIAGIITYAAILMFKPSFAYTAQGIPKQFVPFADSKSGVPPTIMPGWLVSIAVGIFFAHFL